MVWKKITTGLWYDPKSDTYQSINGPSHNVTTKPSAPSTSQEEKRKCNVCGANLSRYNKGKACAMHEVKPQKQKPKPRAKPAPKPLVKAPEKSAEPEVKAAPQVDTTDRCMHDIIRATCSLCS